jgi:hypothetical protein
MVREQHTQTHTHTIHLLDEIGPLTIGGWYRCRVELIKSAKNQSNMIKEMIRQAC